MSNLEQLKRLVLICVVCLAGSGCTTINVDQVRLRILWHGKMVTPWLCSVAIKHLKFKQKLV